MIGTVIFMLSFAVAAFADQFMWFVAAMIILTVGEMLIWRQFRPLPIPLRPKGGRDSIRASSTARRREADDRSPYRRIDGRYVQYADPLCRLDCFYIAAMVISSMYDRPLKKKEPVNHFSPLKKAYDACIVRFLFFRFQIKRAPVILRKPTCKKIEADNPDATSSVVTRTRLPTYTIQLIAI